MARGKENRDISSKQKGKQMRRFGLWRFLSITAYGVLFLVVMTPSGERKHWV
jgi:hypothetical protein